MQSVTILSGLLNLILLAFIIYRSRKSPVKKTGFPEHKKDVGAFYNEQTENFLRIYGKVIQAFRTKNVNTLLDHQIKEIGLSTDMNVLDAGCGVCGPAIYFAGKTGARIEAIT